MDHRLQNIDVIKGFGIISVVLGHTIAGLYSRSALHSSNIWMLIYEIIYTFHMPLFFVVSGYLFKLSYKKYDTKHKLINKIIDLILNYFILSFLYWMSKYPFNVYMTVPHTLVDLCLLPIIPIGVYWYLWVLIIYYLIFTKIDSFCDNAQSKKIMILALLTINFLTSLLRTYIAYHLYMFLWNAIMFYIGILLETWNLMKSKKYMIPSLTISVVALSITIFIDNQIRYVPIIGLIVTIALCSAIFVIFNSFTKSNKFLSYCGRESFVIYAFHVYFCTSLSIIYSKFLNSLNGGGY